MEKKYKVKLNSIEKIEELLQVSQSLASHQLKILRDAKIVRTSRRGNEIIYSLDDKHIEMWPK